MTSDLWLLPSLPLCDDAKLLLLFFLMVILLLW